MNQIIKQICILHNSNLGKYKMEKKKNILSPKLNNPLRHSLELIVIRGN